MIRVLGYENLKLLRRKIIVVVLAIFTLVNGYFFAREHTKKYFNFDEFQKNNSEYIDNYVELQNTISERVEEMLSISIFNQNNFAGKNIVKSAKDFTKIKDIKLDKNVSAAASNAGQYFLISIMLVLATLLISYAVMASEDVTAEKTLVDSTILGNKYSLASKVMTVLIWSTMVSVIMSITIWVMAFNKYGVGSLSASIQSLSEYSSCVYRVSIGGYILLSTLLRVLVGWLLSAMFVLFYYIFDSVGIATIINVLIIAAEYFLYTKVISTSRIAILKFVNIFAMLDSGKMFSDYRNLNVFGNPVNKNLLCIVTCAVLFFVIVFLLFLNKKLKKKIYINWKFERVVYAIRGAWAKVLNGRSIAFHEICRLLFNNGCIFIIAISVIIGIDIHKQYDTKIHTAQEAGYELAMKRIEGLWDEEKQLTYEAISRLAMDSSMLYSYAINDVTMDVERCQSCGLFIKNMGIINKYFADRFFGDKNKMVSQMLKFMLLLIPFVSIIYTIDYRNKARNYVRIFPNGGNRIFFIKFLVGIVGCICIYFFVYGINMIDIFKRYDNIHTEVALQSIATFERTDWIVSVKTYIIITTSIIFVGNILVAEIMMMLSIFIKDWAASVVTFLLIFVAPILFIKGNSGIDNWGYNAIGLAKRMALNVRGSVVTLSILLASSVVLFVLGRRKYVRG